MGAHVIRGMCKRLLDDRKLQEAVVTTASDHPKTSRQNIDERSGVAVKAIETQQHRREGKRKLGRIAGDDLDSPQQFSSVIPIAWSPKRAEKLMGMHLEQDRAGADDFSPFAPLIARCADLIKTTMGSGQRLHLRQCPLTGGLSGPIHIDDYPLFFCPVEEADRRWKREAGEQLRLKARAQSLEGSLTKVSKKTRKLRAMGQLMTTKQSHEWFGKRRQPFVKGQQGGFTRKSIANQHGDKIDHVVLAKAGAGEAHPFCDGFQDTLVGENLSEGGHFSHPGSKRGPRFRGNLDRDRRMRHTTNVSSLFEKRSLVVSFLKETSFFVLFASLRVQRVVNTRDLGRGGTLCVSGYVNKHPTQGNIVETAEVEGKKRRTYQVSSPK